MKASRVLSSMLQFFVAVGLIGVGAFFLVLSFVPSFKIAFIHSLSQHPGFFSVAGLAVLSLGIVLFLAFYAMNRGVYYRVRMEKSPISVDTQVIRTYAEMYWKKQRFPYEVACREVIIHSEREIELVAEVPPTLSLEGQEEFLEKTDRELKPILAEKLGYDRSLLLTLMMK
jgi:hypothetical protein